MKRRIPFYHMIYEDENVLVVYKERDLLTIRTNDPKTNRLNLYHFLYEEQTKKGERIFIVHRLDYETSGLLIFAKKLEVKERLQSLFEERKIKRLYEAVIQEKIEPGLTWEVAQYLTSNGKGGRVILTDKEHGKEAITHLKSANQIQIGTVLNIQIDTGRRAQIRMAIASLGYHLIGDNKCSNPPAKRMYLNAYRLKFPEESYLKQRIFETTPLWLTQ